MGHEAHEERVTERYARAIEVDAAQILGRRVPDAPDWDREALERELEQLAISVQSYLAAFDENLRLTAILRLLDGSEVIDGFVREEISEGIEERLRDARDRAAELRPDSKLAMREIAVLKQLRP